MTALDNAIAHFRQRLEDVKTIEVPEWGDGEQPLIIYVQPVTLAEQDRIYALAKGGARRVLAAALAVRARDEDGKRLFKDIEIGEITKKFDPNIVADVVYRMKAVFDDPEAEEVAGEIEEVKKH